MPANDLYLTARDAAKILNVSERSIHDYKKRGIPKQMINNLSIQGEK